MNIDYDVSNLLEELKSRLIKAFPQKLFSICLHGSLVTHSYNPKTSDIDYIVVFDCELDQSIYETLLHIHEDLTEKELSYKLEGSYIDRKMMMNHEKPQRPRIYLNSNRLMWANYGYEWFFERNLVKSHGMFLYGYDFKSQIKDYKKDILINAAKEIFILDWNGKLHELSTMDEEYLIYGVHTMCRILQTISSGKTDSKYNATQWLKKKYGILTDDHMQIISDYENRTVIQRKHLELILFDLINLGMEIII